MAKTKICPKCGSNEVVKILYGLPTSEAMEAAEQGKYFLGGCIVGINDPTTFCKNCEYSWGEKIENSITKMVYLDASIGGYFGPSVRFEADRLSSTITYNHNESMEELISSTHETITATPEIWDKLIKGLLHCDFDYWLENYRDDHALDGTQWHVEVRLQDGTVITKSGSNAYPGRWKYFCQMISNIADHPFN